MNSKPQITSVQLIMMSVGSALMFPYTFLPILNSPPANQDVWISLIFAFFYIAVINAPALILMNVFRGFTINEMLEMVTGKFFGKILPFFFVSFFLFCFSACMLLGAIFSSVAIFPETPTWAFLLYLIIPIIYASINGAGTLGRLAVFIVSFLMLTIVIFCLLGIHQMDFKVLFPILSDSTLSELNTGAFSTGARYSEILIFFVFSCFLEQKANINKTYTRALIVFGISFALILLPTIFVLGIDFAKNEFNPYFVFSRQVSGYDFIQRVQAINTLAWFPGLILKLALYNFMACYLLSGVFKTKSHRGFVIPIAAIGFALCMIPALNKSNVILKLTSDRIFPFIILPFTFALPLIILIIYLLRKKTIDGMLQQKKSEAENAGPSGKQAAGNPQDPNQGKPESGGKTQPGQQDPNQGKPEPGGKTQPGQQDPNQGKPEPGGKTQPGQQDPNQGKPEASGKTQPGQQDPNQGKPEASGKTQPDPQNPGDNKAAGNGGMERSPGS